MGLQFKKPIKALLAGVIMLSLMLGVFPISEKKAEAAGGSDAVINLSAK